MNIWTYLLTAWCSPSWEANWFAASQEISRISRNPKVHYRTHKHPPLVSILGQPNPVHIPTSHLLEIHPNIIHPSMPTSPHWSPSLQFPHQDPTHPPLLAYTRHMPSPSHSSRFYHPHNTGWGVQITELFVMQSPPFPHYLNIWTKNRKTVWTQPQWVASQISFLNSYYLIINPLNAKLNPICHLLALLGAHHILHVSRISVKWMIVVSHRMRTKACIHCKYGLWNELMTSGTKTQAWKAGYYWNKLWPCDTQYRMIPILNNSNKPLAFHKMTEQTITKCCKNSLWNIAGHDEVASMFFIKTTLANSGVNELCQS